MQYDIFVADSPTELTDLVTDRLSDGWRPQGGVSFVCYVIVVNDDGDESVEYEWAQAMTKDGE